MLENILSTAVSLLTAAPSKASKLRVVLYADAPAFGGAEHYLATLAQNMDSSRFEPYLVLTRCADIESVTDELSKRGLTYDVINAASTQSGWSQFRTSLRYFRRIRPQAVHFNRNWEYAFILPQLAARLAGAKTIVIFDHLPVALDEERGARWGDLFSKPGLRRLRSIAKRRLSVALANTVITPSIASKEILCRDYGYPRPKVVAIPNGVSVRTVSDRSARAEGRSSLGVADDEVLIGAVGRLSHQKGFQFLLPAFALITKQYPHARLCIVGEGELRPELERCIAEKDLQARVTLLGYRRDVSAWLPCFDVFAFPSLYEGMPFALLEAMAAGLPIVAANIPPVQEAIQDGKEGVLVNAGSVQALADGLVELIRNPPRRRVLGNQARKRASLNYSLEVSLKRTLQLYAVKS